MHGFAQRLFAVDILTGVCRGNGYGSVPVVGRGDDDGVDVGTSQELAEVPVDIATPVILPGLFRVVVIDLLLAGVATMGVHITNGDDLSIRPAQETAQKPAGLLPHA